MSIIIKDDYTNYVVREIYRLFYAGIDEKNAGTYCKKDVIITGTDFVPPRCGMSAAAWPILLISKIPAAKLAGFN